MSDLGKMCPFYLPFMLVHFLPRVVDTSHREKYNITVTPHLVDPDSHLGHNLRTATTQTHPWPSQDRKGHSVHTVGNETSSKTRKGGASLGLCPGHFMGSTPKTLYQPNLEFIYS